MKDKAATVVDDDPSDNERMMYSALAHYMSTACDCMLIKAWQVVNEGEDLSDFLYAEGILEVDEHE